MAASAQQAAAQTGQTGTGEGAPGAAPVGKTGQTQPEPASPTRSPAHYLWAVLIARIYEVFPLLCPMCGGQMRLIVFITEGTQIRKILDHIGVDSQPPRIAPARGPPLWDDCERAVDDGAQIEPDWDLPVQRTPDYEVDQRVNWGVAEIAVAESASTSYVTRVIYMSFLAPDVVDLIIRGEQPPELNLERLMRLAPLPVSWQEQRKLLEIPL